MKSSAGDRPRRKKLRTYPGIHRQRTRNANRRGLFPACFLSQKTGRRITSGPLCVPFENLPAEAVRLLFLVELGLLDNLRYQMRRHNVIV